MAEKISDALKKLRDKKRNFSQTFDLIVNLKEMDLKKPESKINEEVKLPYGKGVDSKVVVFSDATKDVNATVLTSADIEKLSENKRAAKTLAKDTDFFLAEAKLMPSIGKTLGQLLAPRGRMPKLVSSDVAATVENLEKSVRIRIKDSPVVQCPVGKEDMNDEEIEGNVKAVMKFLESKLPKGRTNIGKISLKLTMSEPIEIEV